mmetsp:Transcript_33849/g.63748  ORF Transcript_33849/g.63748 Transcript_33849/m.63748 type:complete len:206 (+) Transcript_33849:335-952(+)
MSRHVYHMGIQRSSSASVTQVSHGGLPANHGAPAGARHRPLPPGAHSFDDANAQSPGAGALPRLRARLLPGILTRGSHAAHRIPMEPGPSGEDSGGGGWHHAHCRAGAQARYCVQHRRGHPPCVPGLRIWILHHQRPRGDGGASAGSTRRASRADCGSRCSSGGRNGSHLQARSARLHSERALRGQLSASQTVERSRRATASRCP